MPAYQPTLELELQVCQSSDCSTVTLTDISPVFLDYGLNWLKIKAITIDVYDQEGILLGQKVVDDYYSLLSGTVTLDNTTTASGDVNTMFVDEVTENDYINCLLAGQEFFYRVGKVVSNSNLLLTTIGNASVIDSPIGKLNLQYTLGAEHFGGIVGGTIPDGIYDIKYSVTIDYTWDNDNVETPVTGEIQFIEDTRVLYCNIQCCVSKKLADIAGNFINDPCEFSKSNEASEAMLAWAWIESLPYLEECGDVSKMQETLDALIDYCGNTNCKNCGQ